VCASATITTSSIMSFSLLSTVWDHLASAWTQATDLAAGLAAHLASRIARILQPAVVALLLSACQDQAIARRLAHELQPVRTDIAYAINRVRALEDCVYDHSQIANTRDGEHLDTQNHLLRTCRRLRYESDANKRALELLQLELEAALTEIETLQCASSPSAKPFKTSASSVARTRTAAKTTTSANDPVVLCHPTKTLQQPVRWR
jgi:hypothetical protein